MSILSRQSPNIGARPKIAVFISICISKVHRNRLFECAVRVLGARADGNVAVIPCDELGVRPRYAEGAERARGLPTHFLGISGPLRRELERRYECRRVQIQRDPELEAIWTRLEEIESSLLEFQPIYSTLKQRHREHADVEDALNAARLMNDRLVERYRNTFAEYHAALLAGAPNRSASSTQ